MKRLIAIAMLVACSTTAHADDISMKWSSPKTCTGCGSIISWRVEKRTGTSWSPTQITELTPTTRSYIHKAQPDGKHCYRLVGRVYAEVNTIYSNELCVTVGGTKPNPPTIGTVQ